MSNTIDCNNINIDREQSFFSNKKNSVDNSVNVSIFSQYETYQDNILKANDDKVSAYLDNNINIENILNNTLARLPEEQRARFTEYLQTQNLNLSDYKSCAIGSMNEKYTQRIAKTEDEVTSLQNNTEQECTNILSNKAQFFTERYMTLIQGCSTDFNNLEEKNINTEEHGEIASNMITSKNDKKQNVSIQGYNIGLDTKNKGISATKEFDKYKLTGSIGLKGARVSVSYSI